MRKALKLGLAVFVMAFATQTVFAKEFSLGTALGLRTYQSDGSIYANSQLEANGFIDGEKFGVKLFADFSFYTGVASTMDSFKVKYKTDSHSTKEGFGLAPYYIFKNGEKVKIYAGPTLEFEFCQTTANYVYPTSTSDYKLENSYMTVTLGLFFGTKFHASDKIDIFFELPVTTQLGRKYFSYKKDGKEIEDYQNDGFGLGGGTSFRPYFTPKLGIAYRF